MHSSQRGDLCNETNDDYSARLGAVQLKRVAIGVSLGFDNELMKMSHNAKSIFPLALSPFERYMWLDDQPDYPMSFFVQMHAKGELDLDAYKEAVHDALRFHPLLGCRIETKNGELCWTPIDDPTPPIHVLEDDTPHWGPGGERIDLTRKTGLRIWCQNSNDRLIMTWQIHHACCDGIGAVQFLGDCAVGYAARTANQDFQPEFVSYEVERLEARHHVRNRRYVPNPPSRKQILVGRVRETLKFFRQKPALLEISNSIEPESQCLSPGIAIAELDRAATRSLRDMTRQHGVSLNEVLLRDLLLAIQNWNLVHGHQQSNKDLRILVPTSLRSHGDELMPAANVVGFAFITKKPEQLRHPSDLLTSIGNDMRAVLNYKMGWMFIDTIEKLQKFRTVVKFSQWIFQRSCFATVIHSHLGNSLNQFASRLGRETGKMRMGNLEVEKIACAPPIRPQTRAALCTYTLGGRLAICIRCDPRFFSPDDTRRFLDLFVQQIIETANTNSGDAEQN